MDQTKLLKASQINDSEQKILLPTLCYNESVNEELEKYRHQIKKLEEQLSKSFIQKNEEKFIENTEIFSLEKIVQEKNKEIDKLKKDQDNLLELLTDQDNKLITYKQKLLNLGEKVCTEL
jgi:predicted RNase H-like nuclease (RuvC/YqgF family)